MTKNKPLKKLRTTPLDTKTQNHFVGKKGTYTPPAEISSSVDNSRSELRKN